MYFKYHKTAKLIFVISLFCFACGDKQAKTPSVQSDTTAIDSKNAAEISRTIEKDPTNAELYYRRAMIYYNEKYLDRALDDITQASDLAKDNPLYYFTRGRILYSMNRTIEAAKMYESAITLKPDYEEAQMKLAELYYVVKEHRKSIDILNVVIAKNRNPHAYFFRGMNQKETGDTARAIASFQLAYEGEATFYDAVMQLGILYAAKRDAIALEYFNTAIKLQPKSSEAYFARAYFYQLKKQFQKALLDYKKVIDLDAANADAYYNVGYINFEAGQYQQALRSWDICIQMNNDYVQAYYMRGLLHEGQKNYTDAKMNYEYALQIAPDYGLAKEGLRRVEGR